MIVAFLQDRFGFARLKAVFTALLPLFLFSTICSLSQGPLDYIQIFGRNIFDFLDNLATNIFLPIVALLMCVYMGWFAPHNLLKDQLSNYGTISARLYKPLIFIIRYIAPALIALVLIPALL